MRDAAQGSVAVGFFDGVHLGHQTILRGARTAITFRNHPLSILSPARAPRLIMSLEDRLAAIRACGVAEVVALDFTDALARESPADFMKRLGPCVRCGENWRFGAQGAGDAQFLRTHGVDVTVVPYAEHDGARVSSTRIRAAIEAGKMSDARAMLGRPFSVGGTVFHGKGEGAKLGFPTLNLRLDTMLRLPRGVYRVTLDGRRAIANYGIAPTMGDRAWREPCLEVHVVDGSGDLACTGATVQFLDFIRPERTFASTEALAKQIADDIANIGGGK